MTPTPTVLLSDHDIDAYHRDGYLVMPAITTPDEVTWLRTVYDRLFAERAGHARGDHFDLGGTDDDQPRLPQLLNPSDYAPELRDGLFQTNARAIARQLLGDSVQWAGEHAIFKPARIGAETPWHQDEAYWDPAYTYESLSIWIPLQPATLENGCMQFVPGSHRYQVHAHHTINHDPRIHGLEVDPLDVSGAVPCPIPAGGATIHHNRILHYAGPNTSDIPRRALILMFRTPPMPSVEQRDFPWREQRDTARARRARAASDTSSS